MTMRQSLLNFLMGSGGALLLSAAARSLPEPSSPGSRFYAWFYQFAHLILANFDKTQGRNDIQSSSR
jgi:hypothetical protein